MQILMAKPKSLFPELEVSLSWKHHFQIGYCRWLYIIEHFTVAVTIKSRSKSQPFH